MFRGDNILTSPCSYQGGKQRLAKDIVDIIFSNNKINQDTKFFDLCCGSGAFSIELINRGICPSNITMIDKGVFGEFWNQIANNEFIIEDFETEIKKLPSIEYLSEYLLNLSKQPVDKERKVYHYLLLQSGSFGSKQIWEENGVWKNCSFRSFWQPTETSNRKSHVNPMMPMPNTILSRIKEIVDTCGGLITGVCDWAEKAQYWIDDLLDNNAVVYIDPPYKSTTKYGFDFNSYEFVLQCWKNIPIYVSEGYKMNNIKDSWLLSSGRNKGNISGYSKKKPVEEWLNLFSAI